MIRPSRPLVVGLLLAGLLGAPPLPIAAYAQGGNQSGIGASDTVTARARVQSVDAATRAVTLVGPGGRVFTVIAGPQVINFDKIKAGDTVLARYVESVVYVLSPPGTKPPPSSLTTASVGAAKGATPSGAISGKLVVSGLVVGLDPGTHTIDLVNPTGGGVVTARVRSKAALRNFGQIKVGDTITAVVSQSLAVSLEPAS